MSGGEGFGSDIVGEFVVPGTTTPATVDGFSVDVGGIDTAGSTQVEVFGPGGQLVGAIVANVGRGAYNSIKSNYADVAYFVVTGDDPAGWAIDNLSYTAGTALTKAPKTVGTGASSVHSSGCTHSITPGDPVDCASGDFYHTFTDVSVPGRGPALDLTRTYNSLTAATEGIFGYGWTTSYEANLEVNEDDSITITEGDGSQVTATPDGSDFTLPSWADSTLVHNEDGTYTFVRQQTETFTFNSSGQLTSITDLNGYSTTLSYTSGKLTTVTDSDGRTITLSYGDNGLVSEVTDPDSQHTTYAYDDSGNLTSVTDAMSRVTSFTYDDNHLMLTMTMPNGQSGGPDAGDTYTNTYNGSDQVLTQTDPDGLETTYAYSGDNFSDSGGTTTITDPHGNVETESYIDGQLQTLVKGSSTWDYAFDQNTLGQTSSVDPDGNVTSSDYDADGNLVTSVDAEGNTSTFTYNAFNEPLTVTDPMGILTTYTYDSDGNVETKVVTGVGGSPTATTTYSYGDSYAGDVTEVTDPDGDVTDFTYDSQGDLASATTHPSSGVNDTTKYVYDVLGRVTCSTSPDATAASVTCPSPGGTRVADTTTYVYDADSEETSVTDPLGNETQYTYDGDGNQTEVTDPESNVTLTTYDADDRPLTVTQGYGTSAATTTSSAYDIAPTLGTLSRSLLK